MVTALVGLGQVALALVGIRWCIRAFPKAATGMKGFWKRSGLVLLVVVGATAVAFVRPVETAHAEDSCLGTITSLPGPVVAGASASFGVAPVAGSLPSLSSSGAILTSGAEVAGGTVAGSTALLIGGAALAGVGAGCFFVDVLNWDNYAADAICGVFKFFWEDCNTPPSGTFVGHEGIVWNAPGTYSGPCYTFQCGQGFTIDPWPSPDDPYQLQLVGGDRALTRGGVAIPARPDLIDAYRMPGGQIQKQGEYRVSSNFGANPWCDLDVFDTANGSNDCYEGLGRYNQGFRIECRHPVDLDGPGPNGATPVTNIGGKCGLVPGLVMVAAHPTNAAAEFVLVGPWAPQYQIQDTGWMRRYVTDSRCWNPDTDVSTWRRYDGAGFWDKGPTTARPSVSRCLTGEVAAATLITKVPLNVNCELGVVCWPDSLVSNVTLPTEWVEVATAPEWIVCLAAGYTCSSPQVDVGDPEDPEDDQCEWPESVVVEMTYCTELVPVTGTGIDGGLTTTEVVDVSDTPVGDPTSTGTPVDVMDVITDPPDPPVHVDTNVAIDPGTGAPICIGSLLSAAKILAGAGFSPAAILAQLGCIYGEDTDECWPSGWGWFNPAQWVLKPIKCALQWAFVPDGDKIAESWAGLRDAAEERIPVAWVVKSYVLIEEVADGLGTGISSTSSDCISMFPDTELNGEPLEAAPVCFTEAGLGPIVPASFFTDVRPFAGYMVWIGWAFVMYGVIFGKKGPALDERGQQLSLF